MGRSWGMATRPAYTRDRYLAVRIVLAALAALAMIVIGAIILGSNNPPLADDIVGWGFIAGGFGLGALAVPL